MSSEASSHEQNVVNFGEEITRVMTFKTEYNPSRTDLSLPNLASVKASGEAVITSWNFAETMWKKAVASRIAAFDSLDGLVTRAINAFRICGATARTIDQAEAIVRDLRGGRASEKQSGEEAETAQAEGNDPGQVVLHNSSYDSKISNFQKLIQFMGSEEKYRPNEPDLSLDGLNHKLLVLKSTSDNCKTAEAALEAARIVRDSILYDETTGLVDIAQAVKGYVKSVFGAGSPQYRLISDLAFISRK